MSESAPLKLLTAARSDPGRDPNKQINEDAFRLYESRDGLLVVVCDGMGGHVSGRLASHAATHHIELDWRTKGPSADPRQLLGESIQKAAVEVYALGGTTEAAERPGTTCVAAWLSKQGLFVAHVGDSRAYRYRNGSLYPLTLDHTVVEAWVAAGQLTREQAKGHPEAHRITRALGITRTVEVELRPIEDLRSQDRLLFCSDGLTDMVTDHELNQSLASSHDLVTIAENLVSLANQRGGHDNITVVLVEVAESQTNAETPPAGTVLEHRVPVAKTVPIDATNPRTVLMGGTPLPATLWDGQETPGKGHPKTVPLLRTEATQPLPPRRLGDSYVPRPGASQPRRTRRQLWLVVGIGILLGVLAVLVRLLRHRSG